MTTLDGSVVLITGANGGLGREFVPRGNVGVPFDQRRDRSRAFDDPSEEIPHRLVDEFVMGVDKQRATLVVDFARMAREMDLPHMGEREIGDVALRVPKLVCAGDMHIVDVQQQAAAGSPYYLADEFGFPPRTLLEPNIC